MDTAFADRIRADVDELAGLLPESDGLRNVPTMRRFSAEPVAASAYDVDRLLAGSAAFAGGALAALPGSLATQSAVDVDHLLAWCTSSVVVDGEPIPAWADLSGEYPTADGRLLQIHCNFPHHAAGVVRHLGTTADRDAVAAAIATRTGLELETELVDRGLIAALVRTPDEWIAHPHARASAGLPLMAVERLGDALPRPSAEVSQLRVLDSTRVLAGPVAGMLLASSGADVVRLGAEHLPSVPIGVLSTGFGKRAAFADLRTDAGVAAQRDLLGGADVWIDSYRPGSMAAFGFDPHTVARISPGVVIVQVSAFGAAADTGGPWADRRGYDSIVQSTTGVRWAGGEYDAARGADAPIIPRGLPVQALDHATGFLAAAAAARLVAHQREAGGSWLVRLSLLATRDRLVALAPPRPYTPSPVAISDQHWASIDAPDGRVTAIRPFLGRWTGPPMPLGSSPPAW